MFSKLFAILLCLVSTGAISETIISVESPTRMTVSDGSESEVFVLPGQAIQYCGDEEFRSWSTTLVGKQVAFDKGRNLVFAGTRRRVSSALSDAGWLLLDEDDSAQEAIVERRGGWACASQAAVFKVFSRTIDPKVLASIALNESPYHGHPWPWTLNVAGEGFYFRSREDAYQVIEYLLARGQCEFDVGLMQVNWCYHGKLFKSAWDALLPSENIEVAEEILTQDLKVTGSPERAVAWYHSANEAKGTPYLRQFLVNLKKVEAGL